MKKEYKKYDRLLYCYNPVTDTTVRLDTERFDIVTLNFKFDGWDTDDVYEKCTKKEFKTALNAAIKRLREVMK